MTRYGDPPFDPLKRALLLASGPAYSGLGGVVAGLGVARGGWALLLILVGVALVAFGSTVFYAGWTWRPDR